MSRRCKTLHDAWSTGVMKIVRCMILIVFLSAPELIFCQDVDILKWQTNVAAPPPGDQNSILPLIQLGVQTLPESQLTLMGGIAAQAFGVEPGAANDLQTKLAAYYQKVDSDPLFKELPSLLGYGYSSTKPTHGMATIYQPEKVDESTRTIVFLHGFGGSFHWYLHFLISCFPNDLIMCPAYGVSPSHINMKYVDEAIEAGYQRVKIRPRSQPILICLSAGGFGGFRLVSKHPEKFRSLIVLGSYPPDDLPNMLRTEVKILVGAEEYFVKDGTLKRSLSKLPGGKTEIRAIPNADHFFMLTHADQTRRALQDWLGEKRRRER